MHTPEETKVHVGFAELLDLAAEKVGGRALLANDEFFAPKENLLKPGRGVFIPDKFTEFGKWMDGWETRRRRTSGFDWCIVQLGLPGVIRGLDVDTNHFLGNFPEHCSLDAAEVEGALAPEKLAQDASKWTELLPRTKLQGGSRNLFAISSERRWTHVRLNIYPDGGVARLRVHGEVKPDVATLRAYASIDLAAAQHGGTVAAANDAFFGPKDNLLLPGRAATMGEGWETRRKRVPGFDWIVVKLAVPGSLQKIEVDTNHFKGNYPESCSLEGLYSKEPFIDFVNQQNLPWKEILPRTPLQAHTQHFFDKEIRAAGPFTHVRLNIFPDGGVSRLRLHGTPE
ncbi:MAG: allantoicase [Myxococcota bacterium]